MVDSAGDAGFGENPCGLLERGGGDEAVRRERGFGDAKEEWGAVGGLAAAVHHFVVLFVNSGVYEVRCLVSACHAIPRLRSACRHSTQNTGFSTKERDITQPQ